MLRRIEIERKFSPEFACVIEKKRRNTRKNRGFDFPATQIYFQLGETNKKKISNYRYAWHMQIVDHMVMGLGGESKCIGLFMI